MFTGMHARHARNTRTRSTGSYIGKGARRPGGVRLLAWLTMLTVVLGLAAPGLLGSAAAQTPPSPAPSATATGSISSQGGTATPTATAAPAESGPRVPLIVKFKAGAGAADIDATIKAAGGQSVRELPQIRSRVISVPEHARDQILAAYQKQSAVERAAAAVKLAKAGAPNDPGYAQQWALPKIGWDQAYGVVPVSGSARIAVLDTGVDAAHPDLAGRMAAGQSFTGGNPDSDPNGHGTALAGIAAAAVNNATGVAGVAYASGVSISSVQVLGADGTGWDADVVAGVLWAADSGASVLLMGFSSSVYSAALADALAYAWGKGAVLVAATGNDGSTATTYPAGMPNVIGVAATDQNDAVTAGSNTGSAAVAAPGASIYTTQAGGGYGTVGGTSAAAAHVAGLAALLRAGGKSNADASNQIRAAVDPLSSRPFGRINVAKALGAPVAPLPTATPVPATPTPGATATYVAGANVNSATISIHEPSTSGCGNPKTTFTSGSTACARAVVEITGGSTADYRLQWYEPGNVNGNPVRDVLIANKTAGTYTHDDTLTVTTVGTWTFLVCKTGNAGSCSSGNRVGTATFTVTGNTQPVAANLNVTTFEDTAKNITLSGSDADGNTLTFSITTGPSNGSLGSIGTVTCIANTPSTGTTCTANITYTPNANYNGSDSFTYKANDGTADSSPATVTITIAPVNDAPQGTDTTVTTSEDTAYTFAIADFGFSDPNDTPPNTFYAVRITTLPAKGMLNHNGSAVTTTGASVSTSDIATGKLTFVPAANENGSPYTSFTFQVQDDGGTVHGGVDLDPTPNTLTINVTPVNDAPTVAANNNAVTVNEGQTASNTGTYSDVDTLDNVTISASAGTITKTGSNNGTWNWSLPTIDGPDQSQTVTITANDGNGGIVTTTFSLTVNNVPPTVTLTGPSSANEGETKVYSFTVSDPGQDTWSVANGYPDCGAGGSLVGSVTTNGSAGSFQCSFPDGPATPTVKIKVQDSDNAPSNEATLSVTVANVPPTVTVSGPASVDEGNTAIYTITTTDPGLPETFSLTAWSCGTGGEVVVTLSFNSVTGAGSITCKFPDGPASPTVSATVSDGDDGSGTGTQGVTVTNVPPTVTLASTNSYPVDESATVERTFTFTATDPAGAYDPLTISTSCGTGGTKVANSDSFDATTGLGSFRCIFNDGPATPTVSVSASDGDGGSGSASHSVTVTNVAPTPAISGAPTSSPEGTAISLSGSATDPSSADTTAGFTFAWSVKKTHGSTTTNPFAMGSGASFSFTPDDDGTYEVTLTATDKDGGSGSTSVSITVTNVAPTAALTNNGPVYEGSPVTVSFSNQFDPSTADTTAGFHYAFSCTNVDLSGATYAGSGMSASTTCTFADNGSYQVKGRIIDKDGGYTEYSTTVQVNNVPPTITSLSVNVVSDSGTTPLIGPVPVGTTIQVTANFTDPGTWDTHTCTFAWDDGTSDTSVLAQNTGSGSCETTHTYKRAGVYTVRVTVTDDDDGSATAVFEYIVVYDPNGGFVTGGGWIDSPSGACKLTDACQGATGKANFGFVSRYQKGANVPTGETEFQFKAGNLNFKSSSYQWLVISGPKAQYKGYGTINGSGNYGFLLTAIDGQINGGGGTDKFRIKIWIINSNGTDSDVVYDNQVSCSNGTSDTADPCTVLGGGSIVIHTK